MARFESAVAGSLFAACGLVAWVTGLPFVFPSLGPTAFVLAMGDDPGPRRVVGGHTVGAVAGFASYHLLASGLVATAESAPFAVSSAQLALSGTVAVAATTAGMLQTRTVHAPACATTLIVSLGLLPTPGEVLVLVAAVVLLYTVFELSTRIIDGYRARTGIQ
ncbi:HPP family protein [Haloarchaeobius sp. TZWWS8]|uniref:HPP family protein n=1 Tax=Haloarchaeobius sp. TZWWS8 TaxID=3446121 RepID=UPI003EB83C4E